SSPWTRRPDGRLLDRGRGDRVEDRPDRRLGRDPLGLALEIEDDAVAQRGQGRGPDVVDGDVEPPVEQGEDLARGDERLRATWRRAVPDVVADELRRSRLIGVRGRQDADGGGRYVRRDRDGPGETLHLDDLGGGGHLGGARGVGTGRPVHDRDEVVLGRERDQDLEEEP